MQERFAGIGDSLKQGLSVVADLMVLNFLFILCCIPVITVGAAEVASYKCIFRMLRGEKVAMSIPRFFKDFAAEFKKATLAWLIELVCLILIAGDLWFAVIYSESQNTFFLIFSIVIAVGVLLAAVWLYPLIARFENKLGAYIKNSLLMAFARFPKTLLILIIQLAFVAVPVFIPETITYLGWFWLLFGASLPLYITAKLLADALKCDPIKLDAKDK